MNTLATLHRCALRLVALVILLVTFVALAGIGPAAASTGDAVPSQAVAFTIDPAAVVQLLVAFIMPVVVGLITTRVTDPGHKAIILAALTLITSLLVELGRSLEAGTTFDLGVALLAALPAFVISVATHYGLWKPTGTAAAAQDALGGRKRAERIAGKRSA